MLIHCKISGYMLDFKLTFTYWSACFFFIVVAAHYLFLLFFFIILQDVIVAFFSAVVKILYKDHCKQYIGVTFPVVFA